MSECHQIHPLLSFYIEGELSAKDKRRVAWHLNHCASARKELYEIDKIRKRVSELPEPPFPPRLHERIMNRLYRPHLVEDATEGHRRSRAGSGGGMGAFWRVLTGKPVWGLATAAVLVFAFFSFNPDWMGRFQGTGNALLEADRQALQGASEEGSPDGAPEEAPLQGFPAEETPVPVVGRLPGVLEASTPLPPKGAAQPASPDETRRAAAPPVPVRKQKLMKNLAEQGVPPPSTAFQDKEASGDTRDRSEEALSAQAAPPSGEKKTESRAAKPAKNRLADILGGVKNAKIARKPEAVVAVQAFSGVDTASPAGETRSSTADATAGSAGGEASLPRWSGSNARTAAETQEVITDPQTLKAYWSLLNPGEPPPAVDFTTKAVVMLVSAEKPTAGWRVAVERLEETPSNVVIWWQEESPAPEGFVAQVLTRPWTLQVIPNPIKPVIFKKKWD